MATFLSSVVFCPETKKVSTKEYNNNCLFWENRIFFKGWTMVKKKKKLTKEERAKLKRENLAWEQYIESLRQEHERDKIAEKETNYKITG